MTRETIISILRHTHSMPRHQLRVALGMLGVVLSDRQLRLECKAINACGVEAIGSDCSGYFLITDSQGLERYQRALKSKIFGMWRSYKEGEAAYVKKYGGKQLELSELFGGGETIKLG